MALIVFGVFPIIPCMHLLTSDALLPLVEATPNCSSRPLVATLTCDIEPDYGGRIGTSELLEDAAYSNKFLSWLQSRSLPCTGFVVTSLLQRKLPGIEAWKARGIDLLPHSYTHDTSSYQEHSTEEIFRSQEAYQEFFHTTASVYRAPQGIIMPSDPETLRRAGYSCDASVFPSLRRGLFDYRGLPQTPWKWRSGVLELPFATTLHRRMLTVSYLKLYGKFFWKHWIRGPLPRVLVIDSHLHDFFVPQKRSGLPLLLRLAYARNADAGFTLLDWLCTALRARGYRFTTMREIATHLQSS